MVFAGENLDFKPINDGKTEVIADIISKIVGENKIKKILVVGCGSGIEAAILNQELGAEVVGIDLDSKFDAEAEKKVKLLQADATNLEFEDGSFDLVFSYHALEHIPKYRTALAEMKRVLTADGIFCIGTPNRTRIIGYLGSKDATLAQKINWNLVDWKARLNGKFRNEYGAHAGYSSEELLSELSNIFSSVSEITFDYYKGVYKKHVNSVLMLEKMRLGKYLLPSVYFIGER